MATITTMATLENHFSELTAPHRLLAATLFVISYELLVNFIAVGFSPVGTALPTCSSSSNSIAMPVDGERMIIIGSFQVTTLPCLTESESTRIVSSSSYSVASFNGAQVNLNRN